MIAAWMLYTLAVTFLLYAAAIGAEHVARALRLPARLTWVLAMTAAVALSVRSLFPRTDAPRSAPAPMAVSRSMSSDLPAATTARRTTFPSSRLETSVTRFATIERSIGGSVSHIDASALDRWNGVLIAAWAVASALVLCWLVVSLVRLRRLAGRLIPGTVASQAVLLSDDVGPALLGVLRSRIVLPRWVLELPLAEQEVIVAHERQHATAFDPALVCASMCVAALEPWNALLWMLLARLRLAVEADCDGRVLGETGDARVYGQLLVAMYERTSGLSPHVAFAEGGSNLERRIRRITSRPRLLSVAVGASAIVAMVFATAAWKISAPQRTAPLLSPTVAPAIVRELLPGIVATPTHPTQASPAETIPKRDGAAPVREESQITGGSASPRSEQVAVTFRQIVIAASDSADVARATLVADTVADLLRRGVPFDTLAKQYYHDAGKSVTSLTSPWPLDSLPPSYQKGFAGAQAGDVVSFQVPGLRRPEIPRFVVAQLLSVRQPLQSSPILLTIETEKEAEFRITVPQDSTVPPIVFLGRAELTWWPGADSLYSLRAPVPGRFTTPPPPTFRPPSAFNMAEVISLDTTARVHVTATQNGRVIATGEGSYLVLRRDSVGGTSVGVTIEARSDVPPSVSQSLRKPSRATSSEPRGHAPTGACASPDSIAIRGLSRLRDGDVRSALGITPQTPISGPALTQALKNLYATNSFESNATTTCEVIGGKSILVFNVTERPGTRSSDVLNASLDSISARLVELELQRVSPTTDSASLRRLDSQIAMLHERLRSSPGGVAADREATTRVNLALEMRASAVRSWLTSARQMYTDEYETVRNPRAEDRAIAERLAEIRGGTERRVSSADSDLVRIGCVQRKQTATGFFVDSSDIDRRSPLFSDAVRAAPGLRVSPSGNGHTNVIARANGGGCVVTFVDGVPWEDMARGDIDDYVSATQLIAIELYQPPNVPLQFVRRGEPGCAALVVWTQALRGRRR